jgi:hypothetical protein
MSYARGLPKDYRTENRGEDGWAARSNGQGRHREAYHKVYRMSSNN